MAQLWVGLDFGTSNSGIAVYDGEKVKVLPLDQRSILPEVVRTMLYITREHQYYIGQEAVEYYYQQNVNRVRRYVKKWAGELDFVGAEMHYVRDIYVMVDELKPGRLIQYLKTALRKTYGATGYSGTQVFDRYYRTEDLIRVFLIALKMRAEEVLGEEIYGAMVGRPVRFSVSTEQDELAEATLRKAAVGAGFSEVDFELEPLAAAAYFEKTLIEPKNALIFDFGGGTLDLAILRLGDPSQRQIFASNGIDLAGSDFDRMLIEKRILPFFGSEKIVHTPEIEELIQAVPDWIALPELSTPYNRAQLDRAIEQKNAVIELKRLRSLIFNDLAFSFYNNVEAAKIALSTQGATIIRMDEKDIDLWELYTRYQFEKDIEEYRKRIEKLVLETLSVSGLRRNQIDVVVKTGGSSNIPVFTQMLNRIFGAERVIESNMFSSVTAGLAIRAFEGSR